MRTSLLLLLFIILGFAPDPKEKLQGRWKLQKIEIGNTTYLPKLMDYIMTVSRSTVTYNTDLNSCFTTMQSITDTTISLNSAMCTAVCCDGKNDPIATYIDYNGSYTLHDSLLVITNNEEKVYLKKLP
jgi:hypothetical protein